MSSGGQPERKKKQKELLTKIAARLEDELYYAKHRLAEEESINARARARVATLQVILLARTALQQLTQQGECAPPILSALDQQVRLLSAFAHGLPAQRAGLVHSSTHGSARSTSTVAGSHVHLQLQAAQAAQQQQQQILMQQQQQHESYGQLHQQPPPQHGREHKEEEQEPALQHRVLQRPLQEHAKHPLQASLVSQPSPPPPPPHPQHQQPVLQHQQHHQQQLSLQEQPPQQSTLHQPPQQQPPQQQPPQQQTLQQQPPQHLHLQGMPLAVPAPATNIIPASSAVGVSASQFLKSIVAARGTSGSKSDFTAWWRDHVMRLAMLSHQYRNGAADRDRIEQVLLAMGSRLMGCVLAESWGLELFLVNMETGEVAEPAQGWWDRVVKCMAINGDMQAAILVYLCDWWRRTAESLTRQRRALLQRGLAGVTDWELQHAVLAGLERVQATYLSDVTAIVVLTHTALLTPEQLLEAYLGSWPHLPGVSTLFESVASLAQGPEQQRAGQ